MTKSIFTACLGTETNSFSPMPTGMGLYESTMLIRDGAYDASAFGLPLTVWSKNARALGWKVVAGTAAFAMPAGNTTRPVYESLRDEILEQLKSAMPVDAVLLNLHGAMIADGYPDAEGDFLARVREIVGPDVFIGAELDLHCHLTALKVSSANVLMIYKEYPHVDIAARAEELFSIAERTLAGDIRPVMAIHDCHMLGVYPTTAEPMRGFVDRMSALERTEDILSVSLAHGFPCRRLAPACWWSQTVTPARRPRLPSRSEGKCGPYVTKSRRAFCPLMKRQHVLRRITVPCR
jgi:microcystin degradation protein MlrC